MQHVRRVRQRLLGVRQRCGQGGAGHRRASGAALRWRARARSALRLWAIPVPAVHGGRRQTHRRRTRQHAASFQRAHRLLSAKRKQAPSATRSQPAQQWIGGSPTAAGAHAAVARRGAAAMACAVLRWRRVCRHRRGAKGRRGHGRGGLRAICVSWQWRARKLAADHPLDTLRLARVHRNGWRATVPLPTPAGAIPLTPTLMRLRCRTGGHPLHLRL
mmetsp:Transcript_28667/g.93094  ORF Transcript_28667/g.93094 Transcript_28667/m.93094 type:complete len:217 (-) Transcript_28667:576-1226(-)